MKNFKLVTDSSVQLTQEEIAKYDVTIVPLSVELNGKIYIDGIDINRDDIIKALKKGQMPKTSQPSMGSFIETFDRLGEDGSHIIAITLSDALSGTYQTALQASKMSKSDVTVINSKTTDRGLAFQIIGAGEDIKANKTLDEIISHCEDIKLRTTTDVLIDNLDCLIAGGRISKLAGLITKLINIKIVARLYPESLGLYSKGRSKKLFFKHAEEISKEHENNPIIALGLSDASASPELIEKIKNIILKDNPEAKYLSKLTSPVVTTHTGLGAIGVITLSKKANPIKK